MSPEYRINENSGDEYGRGDAATSQDVTPLSLAQAVKLEKGVVNFELNLTEDEKQALKKLNIGRTDAYNCFIHDIDDLRQPTRDFLETTLNNPPALSAQVAGTIDRLTRNVLNAFDEKSAWVIVSASKPTDAFDIPRWHTDTSPPLEDIPDREKMRKVAVALEGAPTIFKDLPSGMREAFRRCSADVRGTPGIDEAAARKKIAAFVEGVPTVKAAPGQGTIFYTDGEQATVHSEPPITSARLFVSIAPGNKDQIVALKRMQDYWKNKFSGLT